jgi:hypothetical protein
MVFFKQLFRFLLISFALFLQLSVAARTNDSPEGEDFCWKYANQRKREGFLSRAEVRHYCDLKCQTLPKYNCLAAKEEWFPKVSFDLEERLERLYVRKDLLDDSWMTAILDADSMMATVKFFAPWMYALIYIIVASAQTDRRRNRMPGLLVNLIAFCGYFVFFPSTNVWPLAFNGLLALQASFASSNNNIFNDVAAIGVLIVSLVIGTLMIRDLIAQLVMGLLLLSCFLVLFYRKITQSRKEDLFNTLSMLLTLKMCADYTQLVFDRLMIDNPGTLFVRHFVYAMIPWEGVYSSFLNNMFHSSAQLATLFVESNDNVGNHLYVFLLGLVSYVSVFIILRCCLGIMVLKKLHADINIQLAWTGFYSYSIDVFNPFKVIFISIMKRDSRMLWYAIIMCAFNIGEFFTAREFLLMRSILMAIDYLVIESGLAGAYRFLDYEVNLGGLVFEKPGAFPYFFIDSLVDVQRNCKKLFVDLRDNGGNTVSQTSGVGLIRQNMSGPRLFTVRHVLDMKDYVSTEDKKVSMAIGSFEILGDSVDPPVSMYMPGCSVDGSTVRDISPSELHSIKYLFVISPIGAICPVHDWSVDKGDIFAAVNLRSGDSGSPVCAVLSNGICVLAGVVSRGDAREGSRNLISAIKTNNRFTGSPGMVPPYHDVDDHILSHKAFTKLVDKAYDLRECFALYSEEFPDLFPDLDFHRQERDKPAWDGGDFEGNDRKGAVGRRIKSWKKRKAAAKRQFMDLLEVLDYDDESKTAMINFAEGGDIVRFNCLRKRPKRRT